jgi:hypothetical protein
MSTLHPVLCEQIVLLPSQSAVAHMVSSWCSNASIRKLSRRLQLYPAVQMPTARLCTAVLHGRCYLQHDNCECGSLLQLRLGQSAAERWCAASTPNPKGGLRAPVTPYQPPVVSVLPAATPRCCAVLLDCSTASACARALACCPTPSSRYFCTLHM